MTTHILALCELTDTPMDHLPTYSPFSLKIHRALQLHGMEYERRFGAHPGVWKHVNPRGQVPVLMVDEEPVFDSTNILLKLEEISDRTLVPDDAEEAARAWLVEDWADQSLNGFIVAARWADDRNWPKVKTAFFGGMPALLRAVVSARIRKNILSSLVARDILRGGAAQCWSRFEQLLDHLEARAPKSGFWVGNRPSVADVALYGQLHSLRADLTPWQRELLESHGRLTSYLDRVHRAQALDRLAMAS
jgi:glutathione S-transferase